jgi:intracellular proteinase inhibitor BsuPI
MERTPNHGWRRLLTLLGILVICAASTTSNKSCSFGSSNNDNSGDGGNDPTFVATLQIQDASGNVTDSFERGATIQMILTVRNRRDTTQTIDFTDSRTRDFVVVRANTDNVVWQLSKEDAAPSQTPTTLTFGPNQTQTFTTTWDQTDSDSGDQVSVGSYEARGVLVFDGFDDHPLRASQLGSELQSFTIN